MRVKKKTISISFCSSSKLQAYLREEANLLKKLKTKKADYLDDPYSHPAYPKTEKKFLNRVHQKSDGTFRNEDILGNCERHTRKGGR